MTIYEKLFVLSLCLCLTSLTDGYSTKRIEKGVETESKLKRLLLCFLDEKNCQYETNLDQRLVEPQPDRIVYLNGFVYTVDKWVYTDWDEYPEEAIVTEGDKIKFVGKNEKAIELITENSWVYDLHGSTVLPGLHDVHMHPLEAMSRIGGACVLPSNMSPDSKQFEDVFKTCPDKQVGTDWLLGGGYTITEMMDYIQKNPKTNSPKLLLDKYTGNRPAAMLSKSSHSIWVNSKALELAGIDSTTEESAGTVIMREHDSKEPNGLIFENGAMIIMEKAMDPDKYGGILDLNYAGLKDALFEISSNGITSICDARLFWKIKHNKAWEMACDEGKLTARSILGAWAYPAEDDEFQIRRLKEMYSNERSGCSLKTSQIKVYMDGIVESTTAAMEDPYDANLYLPIISDQNIGMNYFNGKRLEKYLKELQAFDEDKGYDFHIHAIGDRGIRDALDAIEAAATTGLVRKPRHRLTHLEIVDDSDITRFRRLEVIADFQLAGEFVLPSHQQHLAHFVKERAESSIPVKRITDAGAIATLSSDWDVSPLNPFLGMQHALQRGKKSISMKHVIEMYTANPAYAMRQENIVGSLVEGMDADMVIIDQNILDDSVRVEDISFTEVIQTIFKGKIVYEYDLFASIIEECACVQGVMQCANFDIWC